MEILQECKIATLTLRSLDKISLFALERKFFVYFGFMVKLVLVLGLNQY